AARVTARARGAPPPPQPVAWLEILSEPRFRGAGRGPIVVAPFGTWRQRHQQRLGARVRLQTEARAAVEGQVEFHVASAPHALEILLAAAECGVCAAAHDARVAL